MSMFTQKMKMLTAVVMENDRDSVVRALLRKGVMEFVHIDALPADKMSRLSSHSSSVPRAALTDARVRIETLMREAGIPLPDIESVDIDQLPPLDMEGYRRFLDRLSGSLQTIRAEQKELNEKLLSYSEIQRYAAEGKNEYLDLRTGTITHGSVKDLLSRLQLIDGIYLFDAEPYISLTFRRDSQRISDLMDKFGWAESPDPETQKNALPEALGKAKALSVEIQQKLGELSEDAKSKILESSDKLIPMWTNVRVHELCEHVESCFSYTKNTTLFSGWVPAEYADDISRIIYETTKGVSIVEWTDADSLPRDEVPVAMKSPKILRPFQRMVDNYNTPEYGSINPTPFTAVAYMLMFMLMFADVGQGLVLLLVGLIGSAVYRKHPEMKDGLLSRYLCTLLIYLGPASMVGGLLFGSLFGLQIPALWFPFDAVVEGEPVPGLINSVYDILAITIFFGIGVIYLGFFLNWINLFRKKRYIELVFDKNGIVGGVMYAAGIWFAYGFVRSGYRVFPSAPWFMPLIAFCLVLILVKEPLGFIIKKHKGQDAGTISHLILSTVMEFLVEVLEIFSGLLSNTLSFMRVAGLGIAHASLMMAFYQLAALPGNAIAFVIIALLGNVLVIVLEGMSAGIQSLRLNYYEFFTKYFTGHGIAFEPVGLRSRIVSD